MHELERFNGKTSNLTLEQLLITGGENLEDEDSKGSGRGVLVGVHHLKGLFATKKMAFWTVLICLINCRIARHLTFRITT